MILLAIGIAHVQAEVNSTQPVPSLYEAHTKFTSAIEAARREGLQVRHVTGVTVPHHILAADLIAKGLSTVDPARVKTVLILSPDHFKKTSKPFATTERNFSTVFGIIQTNQSVVEKLRVLDHIVERSDLFEGEHGIHAILPFIKKYFPHAQIVPIAVAIRSRRSHWDQLVEALGQMVDDATLVVQSTDFSHYLSATEARRHDQKVLNALATQDLQEIATLKQPSDLDSAGSQYVQIRLQRDAFHAMPNVIYNVNSVSYSDIITSGTTSYIVAIYEKQSISRISQRFSGSRSLCLVGDTFFGRWVGKELVRPGRARILNNEVARQLNGCPLVANLEGVLQRSVTKHLGPTQLVMNERLALQALRSMNVIAVTLENNHTRDLGQSGYARTRRVLAKEGIKVMSAFRPTSIGPVNIVAMSDLDNSAGVEEGLIQNEQLARIRSRNKPTPAVAFIHWGKEFETTQGPRQVYLLQALSAAGMTIVVGAHPHRASERLERVTGGHVLQVYSLGNFIFDQTERHGASGSALELRVFQQGTVFARLHPLPNLFDCLRRSATTGRLQIPIGRRLLEGRC